MIGGPALPLAWADRRFSQARRPVGLNLPMDALLEELPAGDLVVFSDDHAWFETYLVLQLRERRPGDRVRGLLTNPMGTYEWFRTAAAFVVVSSSRAEIYPTGRSLRTALQQRNYVLDELPPVVEVIEAGASLYDLQASWSLSHGPTLRVFVPVRPGS